MIHLIPPPHTRTYPHRHHHNHPPPPSLPTSLPPLLPVLSLSDTISTPREHPRSQMAPSSPSSSSSPPNSPTQNDHPPTSPPPEPQPSTLTSDPPPAQQPLSSSPTKSDNQSSPPAKKTPVIPWTHDETGNLIQSYQEKWYSLKRGQLKASQWEEVAVAVAGRCGFEEPSKSGTQCRHKIEKLRKRYRAERQKPYPNAWVYFDLMDQMERGPTPISIARPSRSRRYGGGREDEEDDDEDDDDDDYNPSRKVSDVQSGRKFQTRLRERKIHEFGEMVDGFLRGNRKMSQSRSLSKLKRNRKMRNEFIVPPPRFASDSRFRKRKSRFGVPGTGLGYEHEEAEEEQVEVREEEDEDERNDAGNDRDRNNGRRIDSGVMLMELAGQMKEFAERFVRMEKKKLEIMKDTEIYRMEMENRKMEMIHMSQQKTVELIAKAFNFGSQCQNESQVAKETVS